MTEKPTAYSYIRMSTATQLAGDSLRRQLEASAKFVAEHGLVLDETFKLHDIGVSAFDGSNISDGQLGRFIAAVEAGHVKRGSYLIVESLDRITRQDIKKSLRLLLKISELGITIATLINGRILRPESNHDVTDIMESLIYMSRAHEESQTKSHRLKEVWRCKRGKLAERKLTSLAPAWLRLSEDRRSFVPMPDRVKVVRDIYEQTAAGIGAYAIAKQMNASSVPAFGRADTSAA